MKYIVTIEEHDASNSDNITDFCIKAETKNRDLAIKLMQYYNQNDYDKHTKIHPVLDSDEEIIKLISTPYEY